MLLVQNPFFWYPTKPKHVVGRVVKKKRKILTWCFMEVGSPGESTTTTSDKTSLYTTTGLNSPEREEDWIIRVWLDNSVVALGLGASWVSSKDKVESQSKSASKVASYGGGVVEDGNYNLV